MMSNDQFSIPDFCRCIPQDGYRLLREELLGSLSAESGNLPLDPQALREAESLVFKTFGASRRLSERDKKQISRMIAVKSQIVQLEAMKEANRLTQEIKVLTEQETEMEGQLKELSTKTKAMLNGPKFKPLYDNFVDMRTTTDALMAAQDNKDPLSSLEEMVDFILTRVSRVVTEKEWAEYKLGEQAQGRDGEGFSKHGKRRGDGKRYGHDASRLLNRATMQSGGPGEAIDEDGLAGGGSQGAEAQNSPEEELVRLKIEIARKENVLRAKEKTFQVLKKEIERTRKDRGRGQQQKMKAAEDNFALPDITQ